jgi:hypothetical protein
MPYVLTLALVYAIVMQATSLLHAAASGWVATRQVPIEPLTLVAAPLAAVLGMALAAAAVTAALAQSATMAAWAGAIGWLGGITLLGAALLLHETTRSGRLWRAMAANADGLVAIGVRPAFGLPLGLGLALAVLAGVLAPAPTVVDWLPLAVFVLLATALPDRSRSWATLAVLGAWLTGALVGGLVLLLANPVDALVIAALAIAIVRIAAPRFVRPGAG